jgi:hypothetical protein
MKHRIIHYNSTTNGSTAEVQNFSLFTNRAGYTTYNFQVNKFVRHPLTNSGWVGRTYVPESQTWDEFSHRAHFTNFSFYNGFLGGSEKLSELPSLEFAVFLIAENELERDLVTNCQACVRWEPWAFQVCLIPDLDFFPVRR